MTASTDAAEWARLTDTTYVAQLGELYIRDGDSDGTPLLGLQTDARHRNLSGMVHGGVLMTLFDRSAGLLSRATLTDTRVATATMTINFSRPISVGAFIEVSSHLRRAGRTAMFVDCEAHVDGKLVGTASALMMRVPTAPDLPLQGDAP